VQAIYAIKEVFYIAGRTAAVAGYNSGNAIENIVVGSWPLKNGAFNVAMYINETGGNDHFLCVNDLWRGVIGEFAYGRYFTSRYSYIAVKPAVTGAIDNAAITY
jgi:hypothetical protein